MNLGPKRATSRSSQLTGNKHSIFDKIVYRPTVSVKAASALRRLLQNRFRRPSEYHAPRADTIVRLRLFYLVPAPCRAQPTSTPTISYNSI